MLLFYTTHHTYSGMFAGTAMPSVVNPDTPRRPKRMPRPRDASSSPQKRYARDGKVSWSFGHSIALPDRHFTYLNPLRPSGSGQAQSSPSDPFLLDDVSNSIHDDDPTYDAGKQMRREKYRAQQDKQRDTWAVVLQNPLMNEYCTYLKKTDYLQVDEVTCNGPINREPCKCGSVNAANNVECVYIYRKSDFLEYIYKL